MSPIRGLSEQRRMVRLGKLRLGKKVPNKSGQGEHPEATNYFVVPPEVAKVYGEEPTELPIMIPTEDDELWCSQYYKRYSSSRGLTCRGDGVTCRRMLDAATGAIADRNTTDVVWKEGLPCDGVNCPEYMAKPQRCKETMNLQYIMVDAPGLGIWQTDTSSINSIRNINSAAAMIRFVYKHLAFIPLMLTLEPMEVVNPDDGKKKTVRVLNLRVHGTMRELMLEAARPFNELLLPAPADDAEDHQPIEEDAEPAPAPPAPAAATEVKPNKPLPRDRAEAYKEGYEAGKGDTPPEDIRVRVEAPCPKCKAACVTFNEADISCPNPDCGALIHWKDTTPYIGDLPAALQKTSAQAWDALPSASKEPREVSCKTPLPKTGTAGERIKVKETGEVWEYTPKEDGWYWKRTEKREPATTPVVETKPSTSETKVPPVETKPSASETKVPPVEPCPYFTMAWLKESLTILQGKKLKGWSTGNVGLMLDKISGAGTKSTSLSDAVTKLSSMQAQDFVKKVKEAVELA